jgi:Fur family peroxide stress response transcriptional regulator
MIYNKIMNEVVSKTRNTKYTEDVFELLKKKKHLTNLEILKELRKDYPDLTATTVHRITARYLKLGIIREAPSTTKGAVRYDISNKPHDHFVCSNCDGLRDIDIAKKVIPQINEALGDCRVTGRLVINGSCNKCIKKGYKI